MCPIDSAAAIKEITCESFFTNRLCFGTVHTHPYRLLEKMGMSLSKDFFSQMYVPSQGDVDYGGIDGQLDLILAIVNSRNTLYLGAKYADNCDYCFHFDIDKLRIYLAAYVRQGKNAKYTPYINVHLEIPKIAQNIIKLDYYHILHELCGKI